jgi:hypothetical protein
VAIDEGIKESKARENIARMDNLKLLAVVINKTDNDGWRREKKGMKCAAGERKKCLLEERNCLR